MHTATSNTRHVSGDMKKANGELCWCGGGRTLFRKGRIWGTVTEQMACDLALEGRQEEEGLGGGPSGMDHINDSRKTGKHRSSGNGACRECRGYRALWGWRREGLAGGRKERVLKAALRCCDFVLQVAGNHDGFGAGA